MNKKEKEILKKSSVTYDVAFALRQKGFNEPCLGYYMQGHDFCYFSPPDYTYKDTTLTKWCIAPLWQQVIDWLETKGIFVSIQYAAPDTNKFQYRIDNYNPVCTKTSMIPDGKGWKKSEPEPSGSFSNYSKEWFEKRIEATEAAILEAIKLIP